jgi:hypothetical protein
MKKKQNEKNYTQKYNEIFTFVDHVRTVHVYTYPLFGLI